MVLKPLENINVYVVVVVVDVGSRLGSKDGAKVGFRVGCKVGDTDWSVGDFEGTALVGG